MYVRKVHTYVASAFSVNGTFQIMGPSKGGTQGVPISVARLYCKKLYCDVLIYLRGNSIGMDDNDDDDDDGQQQQHTLNLYYYRMYFWPWVTILSNLHYEYLP